MVSATLPWTGGSLSLGCPYSGPEVEFLLCVLRLVAWRPGCCLSGRKRTYLYPICYSGVVYHASNTRGSYCADTAYSNRTGLFAFTLAQAHLARGSNTLCWGISVP